MQISELDVLMNKSTDRNKIFINSKGFGDAGLHHIIQNRGDIVDLCAKRNNISFQGVRYLCISPWVNIMSLDLSYNPIGAKGCKQLSRANWNKLEMLWLAGNQFGSDNRYSIGTAGLSHLSKSRWGNLSMLKICLSVQYAAQNGIGCESGKTIAKGRWPKLQSLDLKMNGLIQFDMRQFLGADYPQLKTVKMNKNKLQNEQRDKVKTWLSHKFKGMDIEL